MRTGCMRTFKFPLIIAAIAAVSLGTAACGSDDSSSSSSNASTGQTKPVADVGSLTGRSTAVTLDAGFVDALKQLKLTPSPLGDASISKSGVASFPITGGNVEYFKPGTVSPYVQGEIDHNGSGLQLKGGGKTVQLTDFVVDPGKSVLTGKVTVNGSEAAASAPLFFLDGRTLEPLKVEGSEAILTGTKVAISEVAAGLLNDTFKTDAVTPGLLVGIATITVDVPA